MLKPGENISHYTIVSAIGVGGMGEVYLAEDTKLDRRVALKVLPKDIAANQDRLRRFEREARAVSALNHPNILTIHEFGVDDDRHFLVTEFVDGSTLRDEINRRRIPVIEVLKIAEQAAFALSAAHESRIMHRDVKPENIMIRRDNIVKVLDFGLAKLTDVEGAGPQHLPGKGEQVNTAPGIVIGTAKYMSPEQARGKPLDARSDIFSLGSVIYEMLTGDQPFKGETVSDVIAAVLTTSPPPLLSVCPEVPPEVERIVSKALEKAQDDRYQSAKDLLNDLRHLRKHLETELDSGETIMAKAETEIGNNLTARLPTDAKSTAEHSWGGVSGRRIAPFVVAGIVILLGVAGYLAYFGYRNDSPIRSVAVLPFENGSGDAQLDYLSDGLSESVIDKLSQLPQLKVIARSSSFKYRGPDLDLRSIANALGVQAIVTGRVIQRGDDLTIRVEMVDAGENKQLWGEQYVRKTKDAFALQQEIARTVSEKLRLGLSGEQEKQLAKRDTVNPQAYEALLKGKFLLDRGGSDNRKKAAEQFQQAVDLDPNYALAYANLSVAYRRLAADSIVDPREFIPKAESAAQKALELDGNLADAHLTMGNLYQYSWKWADAEREYKRGIELNPNMGVAHRAYSLYLSLLGRHDEAAFEARRARELDPVVVSAYASVGYRAIFARRYDEAITALNDTLKLDPTFDLAHVLLGYAYSGKAMYREAISAYQEAIKLGDNSPSTQIYLGAAYARAGDRAKAMTIRDELQNGKEYVSPAEMAILYAALGDKEAAFASLEKGFSEHDLQLQFLKVDPAFDLLRDDPRYTDLLGRLGFPS